MTILSSLLAYANDSNSDCLTRFQASQEKMLQALTRVEASFKNLAWHRLTARELTYNALWDARLKKNDRFSPDRRAKGEVLYERYDHDRAVIQTQIDASRQEMTHYWNEITDEVSELPSFCGSEGFKLCLHDWTTAFEVLAENRGQLLMEYEDFERTYLQEVQASLKDSPSDHEEFSQRFHERETALYHRFILEFPRLFRVLREKLHFDWPALTCCGECTEASDLNNTDPVLNKIRHNPEAATDSPTRIFETPDLGKAVDEKEES